MIDSLDDFWNLAWTHLVRGVKDRKHGFHQPVIATVEDGQPRARTVVLRKIDRDAGLIYCHTDRRSGKVEQTAATQGGEQPINAEWCFYDKSSKLQVRARGHAEVLTSGDLVDERWSNSRLQSRRCYLAPFVPGTPVDEAHPNLPDDFRDRDPTQEESEAGRENFAVVLTQVAQLDVLHLAHDGHTRAQWTRTNHTWSGIWTAP